MKSWRSSSGCTSDRASGPSPGPGKPLAPAWKVRMALWPSYSPREERGHPGLSIFLQGLETGLQPLPAAPHPPPPGPSRTGPSDPCHSVTSLSWRAILFCSRLRRCCTFWDRSRSFQKPSWAVSSSSFRPLRAGAVHVQRGGELLQPGPQVPEPLLIFVVFDQSHAFHFLKFH